MENTMSEVDEIIQNKKAEEKLLLQRTQFISTEECSCTVGEIPCKDCIESFFNKEKLRLDVENVLHRLKKKQYYVITRWLGLVDCEKQSIKKIAEAIGETKEKVFLIHKKAINKIKKSPESMNLLRAHLCQ